jgi:hypothetical protein
MGGVTYLEILDRRHRVQQRLTLGPWPVRIGRAYGNDVIIDDPYVSPEHLSLVVEEEGERIVAVDLASRNGTFDVGGRRRVARLALGPDSIVRIGETLLRVRRQSDPVPPAVPVSGGPWPVRWLLHGPVALASFALAPLLLAVTSLLSVPDEPADTVAIAAALLVAVLVWAGVWALVTHAVSHEWRLVAHAAVVWTFLTADMVSEFVQDYVYFLLPEPTGDWWARCSDAGLLAWLLCMHLAIATVLPARRRTLVAVGAALTIVGFMTTMSSWSGHQFSTRPSYPAHLEPFPAAYLPATTLERFLGDVDELQPEIDAAVAIADPAT